ncbi:MAG: peptidase associated/transthyretin-like domain-containing protein, partial [Planctomycetota bacterium]
EWDRADLDHGGGLPSEVIARIRTDELGRTSCLLHLPRNEDGKPKRGILYIRPTSPGFQDKVARIGINEHTRVPLERDLVFPPGATVSVRAIGLAGPDGTWREGFPLTVQRLSGDGPPISGRFLPEGEDKGRRSIATFPLLEKGRYRLFAQCSAGVGVVQSIQLDPAHPPDELTILIEEFGTISGKVMYRHAIPQEELKVRAVAGDLSIRDRRPEHVADQGWAFPPRMAEVRVSPDGSFRITGLAPGSYHLAYTSAYGNEDLGRWFDHPSVPTGTRDLELELEETLLVVDLLRDLDQDGNARKTAIPEVKLEKLPNSKGEITYEIRSTKPDGRPHGYPLLPGNRYRLLAWSPFHPVVEREFDAPASGGTWHMEVPFPTVPPGTLTWSGPTTAIGYEVLSPEFGARLERWRARWRRAPEQAFQLPPGRFLIRAFGDSDREDQHGNLGTSRTPFGVEEQWVQIRSGETTHVDFSPPKVGWLEIALDGVGQPDPDLLKDGVFPSLEEVVFESPYTWQDQASFVMRDLNRGDAKALTFTTWGNASAQNEVNTLPPGKTARAIEVFLPGKYELEVRVPGFPLQRKEVVIEEESFTTVKVLLQGKE